MWEACAIWASISHPSADGTKSGDGRRRWRKETRSSENFVPPLPPVITPIGKRDWTENESGRRPRSRRRGRNEEASKTKKKQKREQGGEKQGEVGPIHYTWLSISGPGKKARENRGCLEKSDGAQSQVVAFTGPTSSKQSKFGPRASSFSHGRKFSSFQVLYILTAIPCRLLKYLLLSYSPQLASTSFDSFPSSAPSKLSAPSPTARRSPPLSLRPEEHRPAKRCLRRRRERELRCVGDKVGPCVPSPSPPPGCHLHTTDLTCPQLKTWSCLAGYSLLVSPLLFRASSSSPSSSRHLLLPNSWMHLPRSVFPLHGTPANLTTSAQATVPVSRSCFPG